jgi:DNA-binding MarR family transcriptional regulator
MHKNNQPNLEDLLLHFRRNIIECVKKENIKLELTFSQVEILHFIGITGKKTMKSIADYLKITPPSVTEMIKEMEKKNLVKRTNEKKDRRTVSVMLTKHSRERYISISKSKQSILNQMTSKLSSEDKKSLERIIKIITTE